MYVGTEIRRLREAKGWSQAKLAGAADMGISGISQIETGARNPSAVTLAKIAEALGAEVADLFPKAQASLPLEGFEKQRGEELLHRILNAARRDSEKESRAANRTLASEGLPQVISRFEEDAIRAELRGYGFPDELFEPVLWPLAVKALQAEKLREHLGKLNQQEIRERVP
jgi:transcriptional regulator with XRE-family HTH domain